MTDIPENLPVIPLPGSENWRDAYEWGQAMGRQFPGQDAHDFAMACHYGDFGPMHSGESILGLVLIQQGYHDGPDWIWEVTLQDNEVWHARGWCDYTGWDCQSGLDWSRVSDVRV